MLLAKNVSHRRRRLLGTVHRMQRNSTVTGALRKQKERAVYFSDDGECRLSSVTDKDNLENVATSTTTTHHK